MKKQLLNEGGAVGHIMHLYDDPDLTFGEIKQILNDAATGQLEEVSEKLDGQNLVFSYDTQTGTVKVARNSGNIKDGGISGDEMIQKFDGKGVQESFRAGFEILEKSLSTISENEMMKIFGDKTNKWYSMEILYSESPNVVHYPKNTIVFHGYPVFSLNDGKIEKITEDSGIRILSNNIKKMQSSIDESNWNVMGPAFVKLRDLSGKKILQTTVLKLNKIMSDVKMSDASTIEEFKISKVKSLLIDQGLESDASQKTAERIVTGKPSLNDIKKQFDNQTYQKASVAVKKSTKFINAAISELDKAIGEFAAGILDGLVSSLIPDGDDEVKRLRTATQSAIDAIKSGGDENAIEFLNKQLSRLGGDVQNITTPIEGIVFLKNNKAYKLTGYFAAANQIIGFLKYGKDKNSVSETLLRRTIRNVLLESVFIKRVALIPISAKPYHAGHDALIRLASSECDNVHIFVSTSDRKRPKEILIRGTAMEKIWSEIIEKTLPQNVDITYGGTPVTNLLRELEQYEKALSSGEKTNIVFTIYSDEEDILQKIYTDESLKKYFPTLFGMNKIHRRGVSRDETVNVSGTKMRELLSKGDTYNFAKYLPKSIQNKASEIISILVNESRRKRFMS